jgi:endonuclease-8
MPEGDTIHAAARRIGATLVGSQIVAIETPQPRHALERWPERLQGLAVRTVDAHGKHLFIRFEGGLTLYSHLRMTGLWGVYRRGERWRRSPRRAWLVIRTDRHEVVPLQGEPFGPTLRADGPVLELMTESRSRFDRRLAALGPDVLAEEFDERRFLGRLREDDQSRAIGEALLDQRNLAGVGNVWKSEGYERAGRPCPRCGTAIRARGQGDDNRTTYWCPACQG